MLHDNGKRLEEYGVALFRSLEVSKKNANRTRTRHGIRKKEEGMKVGSTPLGHPLTNHRGMALLNS